MILRFAGRFYRVAAGLARRLKSIETIALRWEDKQPEKCAVFQRVALRKVDKQIYEEALIPQWENNVPSFVVVRNWLAMLHSSKKLPEIVSIDLSTLENGAVRGMFSSLYRRAIIGFLVLAIVILGIAIKLLVFQHPQPASRAATTGYRLQTITYCSPNNIPQLMDIYTPTNARTTGLMPLIEMVHGGGWTTGSKANINWINPTPEAPTTMLGLLADGFVVTSIDYRLAPQYKFPDNIEDVKCSIRYLRTHAAQYHIDPNHIGLMGPSAGGHLVSLAGLAGPDAGWDVGEYTDQSSAVQAVVDMFGPEYIASGIGDPAIGNPTIFGSDPRGLQLASPPLYIANTPRTDPPFLILQGDQDSIVPPYHSLRFYNDLLSAGQPAILQMVQNAGHGFAPIGGAIVPSANQISTLIIDFFMKNLARGGPTTLSTVPSIP